MAESDEALIRRTLNGDTTAFGILVERYCSLVRGLIYERVRRHGSQDDLVQEAFCAAFEALPGLRDHARFGPWLARIAQTTALHWVRRETQRVQVESMSDWSPAGSDRPDQVLESQDRSRVLWEALDQLPDDLRRLLILCHLEGCSCREAARFLGQPVATVHWRLRKAQRQLGGQVLSLLEGERISGAKADPRQMGLRVLAALPAALFLSTRSSALSLPWWSCERLVAFFTSVPVAVTGGIVAFFAVAYLAGSGLQGNGGSRAARSVEDPGTTVHLQGGAAGFPRGTSASPTGGHPSSPRPRPDRRDALTRTDIPGPAPLDPSPPSNAARELAASDAPFPGASPAARILARTDSAASREPGRDPTESADTSSSFLAGQVLVQGRSSYPSFENGIRYAEERRGTSEDTFFLYFGFPAGDAVLRQVTEVHRFILPLLAARLSQSHQPLLHSSARREPRYRLLVEVIELSFAHLGPGQPQDNGLPTGIAEVVCRLECRDLKKGEVFFEQFAQLQHTRPMHHSGPYSLTPMFKELVEKIATAVESQLGEAPADRLGPPSPETR